MRAVARERFLRDGYARTSMSAVAKAAGVAERTLYLAFPTKAALLDEVIVTAIRGEETDQPLNDQMRAALDAPPAEILPRFAAANGALMARAARLIAIGESAATLDPQLAILRDRAHASMRSVFGRLTSRLAEQTSLTEEISTEDAADTIYALANESVYLRLTDGRGWSQQRYAQWLARVLQRTLTGD